MKQKLPEEFRRQMERSNKFAALFPETKEGDRHGLFALPRQGKKTGEYFRCLVSSGEGWDHVSVSIPCENRCPTWEEMCYIKDQFFDRDEVAVQFHPRESDYVNNHRYCLHLWRCQLQEFPTPDPLMIGIKAS